MKGYECGTCGTSFWSPDEDVKVCPLCRAESPIATGRKLGEWKDAPDEKPSF